MKKIELRAGGYVFYNGFGDPKNETLYAGYSWSEELEEDGPAILKHHWQTVKQKFLKDLEAQLDKVFVTATEGVERNLFEWIEYNILKKGRKLP